MPSTFVWLFFMWFCLFINRKIVSQYSVCWRAICWFLRSNYWEQWDFLINFLLSFIKMLYIPAFTKITRVNSQEYELKLVDTAGQDEYSIFPGNFFPHFFGISRIVIFFFLISSIQYGLSWICAGLLDNQSKIIWSRTNYLR